MISGKDSVSFDLLRFPLIVAVVFIHDSIPANFGALALTQDLVGAATSPAVPVFFAMSGALFFNGLSSRFDYYGKLRRRVKSLLIPYIIWNILTIAYLYVGERLFPEMVSGVNEAVSSYSFTDWFRAFWDLRGGFPVCYQMWFIRDLMVLCLISPLIRFLIEKTGIILPALFGLAWLAGLKTGIPGLSETALLFFSLGGWYSMSKRSITADCLKNGPLAAGLFVAQLLAFAALYTGSTDTRWTIVIYRTVTLSGAVYAFAVAGWFANMDRRANKFLTGSSFFVFAAHAMVLSPLIKVVVKYLTPTSGAAAIAEYFLVVPVAVVICLAAWSVIKRLLPRTSKLISGSRS